jgi:glyoxylase-like metal-dependent hydrolase (beta-lactamase superfamily II)
MGIEIDFLAVGDKAKSGDAIALRFGNLLGNREEQTVITVDGGTLKSGERLVEHVKTYYKTNRVDFGFLTHPDGDHASGMRPLATGGLGEAVGWRELRVETQPGCKASVSFSTNHRHRVPGRAKLPSDSNSWKR